MPLLWITGAGAERGMNVAKFGRVVLPGRCLRDLSHRIEGSKTARWRRFVLTREVKTARVTPGGTADDGLG